MLSSLHLYYESSHILYSTSDNMASTTTTTYLMLEILTPTGLMSSLYHLYLSTYSDNLTESSSFYLYTHSSSSNYSNYHIPLSPIFYLPSLTYLSRFHPSPSLSYPPSRSLSLSAHSTSRL